MNDATLQAFRDIADQMAGPEPRDWQWIGPHASQCMFGITQERAEGYAERHGGTAQPMCYCGGFGYDTHQESNSRCPRTGR